MRKKHVKRLRKIVGPNTPPRELRRLKRFFKSLNKYEKVEFFKDEH